MIDCSRHSKCVRQDVSGTMCFSDPCGAYHALSPLLHQLGIFSSYNGHSELISRLVEQQREVCLTGVNVLVVGFASKESARALLDIPVMANQSITFLDRCPTPVNQSRLEFCGRSNLSFLNADILDFHVDLKFDLILTDSLLRQFDFDDKRRVLTHVAHLLKNTGKVLFREHVGANNCDLSAFLASIDSNPALLAWEESANEECRELVRGLMPSLKGYMSSVGGSYMSWDLFFRDIGDADLEIDRDSVFRGNHGIVVCQGKCHS